MRYFAETIFFWMVVAMIFGWLLAFQACDAHASPMPLPTDEATRDRLAQGMVAEANWTGVRDHAAIGWVLAWRWRNLPALQDLEFGEVVTRYVAAFDPRSKRSRRQRWIRGLNATGEIPDGWDMRLSWPLHRPLWRRVLMFAQAFLEGRVPDPCGGRARHWGAPSDKPSERLRRIDCGPTRNMYYAYRGEP